MEMDTSTFWSRGDVGPGPYPDVLSIPTPPLQRAAIFIMFFLPALATCIFGLRIYTRVSTRTIGLDDYLCGMALIADILVCSSLYMFFKLSYYGWPDADVPDFDPAPGLWWNFFEQLCYNPVLAFVKSSILIFLLRLGGQKDIVFKVIWGLMIFTILHAIAVFFGALFQCVPIKANWYPALRKEESTFCIDNSFHIIQSSITILTDVLVLALPFWIFLGLRMKRATKLAVLSVFVVGAVVPIVAIIRLVNIYNLLYLGKKSTRYNIAYVWTAVETNFAVISCSMPALRPLFSRLAPRLFGSSGTNSNDNGYLNSGGVNGTQTFGGSHVGGSHHAAGPSRGGTKRESHSRNYMLKDLHPSRKHAHTEIRGVSPSGSEEEIMTYNGILRTTNVNVSYEDAKRSETASHVSSDVP